VAELVIPEVFRGSFHALIALPEANLQQLYEALADAEPFQRVGSLQALVQETYPDDQRAEARRLAPALLSLCGQLRGTPARKLADLASRSADLALKPAEQDRLRERLMPLLASPALFSTANAIDLVTQHARNFRDARVYLDVRPAFASDVEEEPSGAVLIATLQLQTWDREGNDESFYIALDENDLSDLHKAVERARTKTRVLTEMLETQGVARFRLDEREL
jgi:hypothetical protein